jgi:hypothetical protein
MLTKSRAARWGDNDQHFGPFTYGISDYRPWAMVLTSSGGGQDNDRACQLRINLRATYLIVVLPNIVKPHMTKVYPKWDAATVERLGRDYYWDIDPRSYGFSVNDGHFNIYYGRTGGSSCDSSIEQRWSCFLPWTQWRHVRHSFYGLQGEHPHDEPQTSRIGDDWEARKAREATVPTAKFAFDDFDGERIVATTKIEEREWRFGTGWFKWLSWFRRAKVRRSLDMSFSSETGPEKGSWKGGTVGTGIDMLPGELHEAAFRRYCDQEHRSKYRKYSVKFLSLVPPSESAQ